MTKYHNVMPKGGKKKRKAGKVSAATKKQLLLLREQALQQWRSHQNKAVETFDIWSKLVGIHPETVQYLRKLKYGELDEDGKLDQDFQDATTQTYGLLRSYIEKMQYDSPIEYKSKMLQDKGDLYNFISDMTKKFHVFFAVGYDWPSKLPVIDKATAAAATAAATADDAAAADEATADDATAADGAGEPKIPVPDFDPKKFRRLTRKAKDAKLETKGVSSPSGVGLRF